jgi:hypothetical protein
MACIALLIKQLEQFTGNEPGINAFLIVALVELQATEAAPLMERAFAARCVDLMAHELRNEVVRGSGRAEK